ncbi:imidazolonepropionase [Pedobacter yulinensis]|uniref:Imidazolonepropionase n=1 Tax=Pedobacter yulinensis TaxID=2126353 RepID=A0A2T3HL60_9SPHI|nr:amidohydrolase family protein [Pedobacter yulinensis]PST83156.1 imidazolonepropionase [Pedobacter yulinensis]
MHKHQTTAVVNATVFDGSSSLGKTNVIFSTEGILAIGAEVPHNAVVIDGTGATLLPGLIDAHTHTSVDSLRCALQFGVTTELEMMGGFTKQGRALQLVNITDIADVRSAGMGLTPPGGHPDELIPKGDGIPDFVLKEMERMSEEEKIAFLQAHERQEAAEQGGPDVTTAAGARQFVHRQFANGADYFKVMIEEGTVMNSPGLPMISEPVMQAAVSEAHALGMLTVAHVLTAEAARTAVNIGIDGLAHLFIDRPEWTASLVRQIAEKNIFVTPCLVLNASIIGKNACAMAHDERVAPKLDSQWVKTMCSCFHTFPGGKIEDSYKNVMDLHRAGVDILVGTDVSVPAPHLGGLAHGVSVHHEMQLLVEAGMTPIEALRAATSVPCRRFGLTDRGEISIGRRADLVLVDGDPTSNISDSLSITQVWKAGTPILPV